MSEFAYFRFMSNNMLTVEEQQHKDEIITLTEEVLDAKGIECDSKISKISEEQLREILELREGHPTRGVYWFPSYNSSEGVRAMEFLKRQIDAGIQPQDRPYLDIAFVNRNFSVMLGGSWMPLFFPIESWPTLEQEVGFIPMFPVPNQTTQTSTMMGGWEVAIPSTSQNSDLSWELITIMAQPEILTPFLQEYGYLPTQKVLGEGPSSQPLKESVPYFEEMVSLIPYGRSRPNIPEYPEIAEHVTQAIQQVYNGSASPEDALNTAASKSADSLGWIGVAPAHVHRESD